MADINRLNYRVSLAQSSYKNYERLQITYIQNS